MFVFFFSFFNWTVHDTDRILIQVCLKARKPGICYTAASVQAKWAQELLIPPTPAPMLSKHGWICSLLFHRWVCLFIKISQLSQVQWWFYGTHKHYKSISRNSWAVVTWVENCPFLIRSKKPLCLVSLMQFVELLLLRKWVYWMYEATVWFSYTFT